MQPLDTIACVKALLARQSITPDDAGCQHQIGAWLAERGFVLRHMPFGEVSNLWATRGEGAPLVIFAGHTDVVPPGEVGLWRHPPFSAIAEEGHLYGRGAADMKGSIAAFVSAIDAIRQERGTLAMLLTSDEEGPATQGTARVVEQLKAEGVKADAIVVGEPSSRSSLADCVRIGRRGSLAVIVELQGKGGHVAYPEQVQNPIHLASQAIAELVGYKWDEGDADFPPTSLQFTSLECDSGAANVAPGSMRLAGNLRFSPAISVERIKEVFTQTLSKTRLQVTTSWNLGAMPFISKDGRLRQVVCELIREQLGYTPELSTAGGTSDGRFLIELGDELIELGPSNTTIHQVNECVATAELLGLRDIYAELFSRLLA